MFERREKKSFVQLALLIVLFPVVLAQLFVGVGLLGVFRWTCVFFFLRWQEKRGVEFAWLMFLLGAGLAQLFFGSNKGFC